jgi:hypothetical protein
MTILMQMLAIFLPVISVNQQNIDIHKNIKRSCMANQYLAKTVSLGLYFYGIFISNYYLDIAKIITVHYLIL